MFDHCALLFFLILLWKIFFSDPNKAKFFFTNIIFSSYLLRVCTILPDKCWWNQRWPIRMHLVSHSPMRKRCGLMGVHLVSHWPWRNRCWSIGMHLVSHWPMAMGRSRCWQMGWRFVSFLCKGCRYERNSFFIGHWWNTCLPIVVSLQKGCKKECILPPFLHGGTNHIE